MITPLTHVFCTGINARTTKLQDHVHKHGCGVTHDFRNFHVINRLVCRYGHYHLAAFPRFRYNLGGAIIKACAIMNV